MPKKSAKRSKNYYFRKSQKLKKSKKRYVGSTKVFWQRRLNYLRGRKRKRRKHKLSFAQELKLAVLKKRMKAPKKVFAGVLGELKSKFHKTVNWTVTYDEMSPLGHSLRKNLKKEGSFSVSDLSNLEAQIKFEFLSIFDEYKTETRRTIKNIDWTVTRTLEKPLARAIEAIRDTKLRSCIFALPNSDTSIYQATENCMIDYIKQNANSRKDLANSRSKVHTHKSLLKMVNRNINSLSEGISTNECEIICKKLNLNMTAVMLDDTLLVHRRSKTARTHLMFRVHDGHCYPIADHLRQSFAQTHSLVTKKSRARVKPLTRKLIFKKNESLTNAVEKAFTPCLSPLLKTKKTKKTKKEKVTKIIERPPYKESELLNIMFDQKLQFTLRSRGGETRSININNTKIVACENISETKRACKHLDIPMTGQTLSSISKEYFFKHYYLPKSSFNDVTLDIVMNWDNMPMMGNVDESAAASLRTFDINKCYASVMSADQQFPIYTCLDYPEIFNGSFLPKLTGNYYLRMPNSKFFKSGWHSHLFTAKALKYKLITREDISHQFISQYCISSDDFKTFKDKLFELKTKEKTAKKLFNFFNGNLNRASDGSQKNYITNNRDEALKYCATALDHDFLHHFDYKTKLHRVTVNLKNIENENYKPIYHQVIDGGRMAVYELYLALKKENPLLVLKSFKTDSVTAAGIINPPPLGIEHGEYHEELITPKVDKKMQTGGINQFVLKSWRWNKKEHSEKTFDYKKMIPDGSCCLNGFGGSGKSYIINNCIPDEYERLAFTHTASNNINGKTFNNFYGFGLDTTDFTAKDVPICPDEYSMIPENIYSKLVMMKMNNPDQKIILSGDDRQIQFIPNTRLILNKKKSPRLQDCYSFAQLCGFNLVNLNYAHRSDVKFAMALTRGEFIQHANKGEIKKTRVNLTITNALKDKLNQRLNKEATGATIMDIALNAPISIRQFEGSKRILIKQNTPWISCKAFDNIKKNEFFELTADEESFILTGKKQGAKIPLADWHLLLGCFELRYAMTVNKCQGQTIDEPFTIHQWNHPHNDIYKKYTSCSRAIKSGQYYIFAVDTLKQKDIKEITTALKPQRLIFKQEMYGMPTLKHDKYDLDEDSEDEEMC